VTQKGVLDVAGVGVFAIVSTDIGRNRS